jgi:hypothetical protein
MDTDIMAAMGIAGFGKQVKKRELDPARFDKNKREEVGTRRMDATSNSWFTQATGYASYCQNPTKNRVS